MPATSTGAGAEGPSVPMSFANNFWGKDDAGVQPLLARMHSAKLTSEELKAFYRTRAEIEDDYARKLLSLCRKPLGKDEAGTLKASLDVMRGEVESMARAHKSVAEQMKTELEEPMGAFAGMMKERRKIVQGGVEKLLKVKTQQGNALNKARDRYEQDCLRIKGYLAQGHMVMGQEERKNKAKLEKTQLQMSASEQDYKQAVAALEETTGRWNRDWKAACDKFQDLEEERLDFTKSSLWTFANIASTVCVTDDASCEKIRLSLEDCEVERDIASFIAGQGTGQEIPEPPRFINFCRDDPDSASEVSDDDYSVAQFPRSTNPAYRTSSPQPSALESHRGDLDHDLARQMGLGTDAADDDDGDIDDGSGRRGSRENTPRASQQPIYQPDFRRQAQMHGRGQAPASEPAQAPSYATGPPEISNLPPMYTSDRSTNASPSIRPESSNRSDYSAPTSVSSAEPLPSPTKQQPQPPQPQSQPRQQPAHQALPAASSGTDDKAVQKKRSGFFSNSPFRRRSKHDKSRPNSVIEIANRHNANAASSGGGGGPGTQSAGVSPTKPGISARDFAAPAPDLDPVDPRASFQLNVGSNVFDVASPDARRKPALNPANARFDKDDPVAAALEELRGLTGRDKGAAVRTSADRYHGLATPQPGQQVAAGDHAAAARGTPPPGYSDQSGTPPVRRLGAPAPAHTAASMMATTQKYTSRNADMYGAGSPAGNAAPGGGSRPGSRAGGMGGVGGANGHVQRSASPVPMRSTSPRPGLVQAQAQAQTQHDGRDPRRHQRQGSGVSVHGEPLRRSASPNPYGSNAWAAKGADPAPRSPTAGQFGRPGTSNGNGNGNINGGGYGSRQTSPMAGPGPGANNMGMRRDGSPQPHFARADGGRPGSGMAMTLSNGPPGGGQQQQQQQHQGPGPGPGRGGALGRPVSYYGGGGPNGYTPQIPPEQRSRSKSLVNGQQFSRDGRPILHFARAMYSYTAAIPEELSFAKNDVLAVTRLQDDGWWEAEVTGRPTGRVGLVPSNYLQKC